MQSLMCLSSQHHHPLCTLSVNKRPVPTHVPVLMHRINFSENKNKKKKITYMSPSSKDILTFLSPYLFPFLFLFFFASLHRTLPLSLFLCFLFWLPSSVFLSFFLHISFYLHLSFFVSFHGTLFSILFLFFSRSFSRLTELSFFFIYFLPLSLIHYLLSSHFLLFIHYLSFSFSLFLCLLPRNSFTSHFHSAYFLLCLLPVRLPFSPTFFLYWSPATALT